jgi:putative ABC transport system permease protein
MPRDLSLALRALRRAPTFSVVAVLTLALAIGSSAAVFSVVDTVVLRGLPYGNVSQLRTIYEGSDDGQGRIPSFPTFLDWQRATQDASSKQAVAGLAFIRGDGVFVGSDPERKIGAFVTPGFFAVLETRPALGRTFAADEEQPGGPRVAVISDRFFHERFGGDPSIVGKAVAIDSVPTTVIGVMPQAFAFPNFGGVTPAVWMPIAVYEAMNPLPLSKRELHVDSRAVIRLAPGADSARAAATMAVIQRRLAQEYPKDQGHWTHVQMNTLSREMFGSLWSTLALISGVIVLVLLLACANVANLLLIRSSVRGQELAVRAALGAGRWRLARLVLTEAGVLALVGGALGVLLAAAIVHVALPLASQQIPFAANVKLDARTLLFAFGVTALTTLLVGALPALRISRSNLVDRLRGGAASRGGVADIRLRNALVAVQFALAITLLVGAGLLVQSVRRISQVDLGYEPQGLVNFAISPPVHRYTTPAEAAALYQRILTSVAAVPGVSSIAAAGGALLSTKIEVAGRTASPDGPPTALYHPISADFLRTMHVSIEHGRGFTDADMRAPMTGGLLVNDTLARQLWPKGDAVGARITIYRQSQARTDIGQPITLPVIGVVADYHQFGPTTPAFPQVYLPYTLEVWPWMQFVARTNRAPAILDRIEKSIKSVEPALTFFGKPSFDRSAEHPPLSDPRMFVTALLSSFAAIALLLAAIGLYGVVTYAVTQRTREIGIRIAIGATPGRIMRLLMRQALGFVLFGIAGGLLAAAATVRVLQSLLFQTGTTDVATFVAVPLVLGVVAIAASVVPAVRAGRVDPAGVMRAE